MRAELLPQHHGLRVVVAVHVRDQEAGDVGQPVAELRQRRSTSRSRAAGIAQPPSTSVSPSGPVRT